MLVEPTILEKIRVEELRVKIRLNIEKCPPTSEYALGFVDGLEHALELIEKVFWEDTTVEKNWRNPWKKG